MGMQIVDVLTVNIDSYPVIYQKRGYEYSAGAPSPDTSIIAGIQEVSVSVPVTFEIAGFALAPAESNRTIEASINERFNITLASNPSTGYRWHVSNIDETVAKLVDDNYIPPNSDLLGAGGIQVLTFEALKEGMTAIELEYVRPWQPDSPASTYTVNVAVSSAP
jgi:inhibitor of cysteine peptidase